MIQARGMRTREKQPAGQQQHGFLKRKPSLSGAELSVNDKSTRLLVAINLYVELPDGILPFDWQKVRMIRVQTQKASPGCAHPLHHWRILAVYQAIARVALIAIVV